MTEPMYRYPTGLLRNTATNRIHPILFGPNPRPSDDLSESTVCRHKSIGHHTTGFETMEEANTWIETQGNLKQTGLVWDWDGYDIPAITMDFDTEETL